jgi:hypothetical protein
MRPANAAPEGPTAHFKGWGRGRLPVVMAAVFVVVCLSRLAVFPASIWEQDEAYFAAAVVEIGLVDSAPHPPFFPLWIGIGKALHLLGLEPAAGLQAASAVLSALMFFPLVALWSRFMKPAPAMAAAVLGLSVPGVWLFSGRAFSGTAATAMLVAALACWTRPDPDRRWLAVGSCAAGLAILIRPHFGLVIAAVILVMVTRIDRRRRAALVAPAAVVVATGAAVFVVAAGGLAAVAAAVSEHAALHFGALPSASRGLLDSGLARVLGHPLLAVGWCLLVISGVSVVLRSPTLRAAGWPVTAALVAVVIVVFGLSNPAHPRYAVPIVILSCGFVVLGIGRLLNDRWALISVAAAVVGAAAVVLPVAATYRHQPSPPLRALAEADRLADRRGGVVVVDRTLHSFVVYREAVQASATPVVFDHLLDLGASPPAPASRTVMVYDDHHDDLLVSSESRRTFSCDSALLRRLAQGRFLEVTVADGATLDDRSDSAGSLVIIDDLASLPPTSRVERAPVVVPESTPTEP